MPFEAIFTLALLAVVILALVSNRIPPDVVLMGAVTLLILFDVLSPSEALSGFSNTGIITIATLYVVAAGLIETGAVQWLATNLLGSPKSAPHAQLRLFFPTALLSAFTNNTAVVAMFTPAVQEWAERLKISPSKLLIPLSYAAILGGTCTIIGTSTNLIIYGLLQSEYSLNMGLFEIAAVGLPISIAGAIYLFFFADRLLPSRSSAANQVDEVRQYCVEFVVEQGGPLTGKSISDSGLRNLGAGFLIEISRGQTLHTAIDPSWNLQDRDILTFLGTKPAAHEVNRLNISNSQRCLVEVVLGSEFPALGQTIKASRFRTRFNAVILSVSRNGQRLPGKLGEMEFKVGDTLLLESGTEFVEQYRFRKDFLLVSPLNNSTPPDFKKVPLSLTILGAMIISTATGFTSILESTLLAGAAMLLAKCIKTSKARRQIDLQVLTVIASSFALGAAMKSSGAASLIASTLMPEELATPIIALIIVYLMTVLFTEVITNNAAAILMFPIAQSFSQQLDANILPFAVAIMIAASASFITPLGYQTNLMVYGPGQYRYYDYLKIGTPLSILVALITITVVPAIWSF